MRVTAVHFLGLFGRLISTAVDYLEQTTTHKLFGRHLLPSHRTRTTPSFLRDLFRRSTMGSSTKGKSHKEARAMKVSKPKREVQVVKSPMGFPISKKASSRKRSLRDSKEVDAPTTDSRRDARKKKLLDWHDTAKEIRNYGATAFVGKQKRDFEDEQYFALTGRHKKKPKTPLPILRGLKKAATKREAKAREEARQAGIILPKAKQDTKKYDSTYRIYGPAPSIGFMKNGVFKVQTKKKT